MYATDAQKLWQSYQGSQRKPADFEDFWQAGPLWGRTIT